MPSSNQRIWKIRRGILGDQHLAKTLVHPFDQAFAIKTGMDFQSVSSARKKALAGSCRQVPRFDVIERTR